MGKKEGCEFQNLCRVAGTRGIDQIAPAFPAYIVSIEITGQWKYIPANSRLT